MAAMNLVAVERCDNLAVVDISPLVAASEAEGLRFVRRLWDEYLSGANGFNQPGETLFIACAGSRVLGVGGLTQDSYSRLPWVGRVRRLYVLPAFRRHQVGTRLVTAIITEAAGYYDILTLRTDNPLADAFYHKLGFGAAPDMPESTHMMYLRDQDGMPINRRTGGQNV